jgi:hypothetical protein
MVASIAGSAGDALEVGAGVGKGDGESLGAALGVGEPAGVAVAAAGVAVAAAGVAVAEACAAKPPDGLDEWLPATRSMPKPIASRATSVSALRASAMPMMRSAEGRCTGQS